MVLPGVTRLPDLGGFAGGVVSAFEGTILPAGLVEAFAPVLSFVGMLLLLGLFRKQALLLGVAVMLSLIFGAGLQQNGGTLATQMQYLVYFGLLLAFLHYDCYALDRRR
jgi:thiosulfate dehydrogenase [quinone] large subunit